MKPHIVIIGGGITGLTAAYRLATIKKKLKLPLEITLIEATDRLGGVISSQKYDDYVVEHGPDSLIDQPVAINLFRELDLTTGIVPTNKNNRQAFIAFQGKLHKIPKGFAMIAPSDLVSFASSSLFSVGGKIRALMDLVIPKRSEVSGDESVAEFIQRRLGKEIFERAAQSLVGGIYMADLNQLSAKASLKRFVEMERNHGSIIRGLLKEDRTQLATASGARYSKFVTLTHGMQSLVDKLSDSLNNERILLSSNALSISYCNDRSWQIKLANEDSLRADKVIVAVPAFQAAKLLENIDSSLAANLAAIENTSSAVVNLLFNKQDIGHSLDGFGFVVPETERRKILACAFISVKFPGRARANEVMLRVFIGGSFMPEHKELSDEQLKDLALSEIKPYLQVRGIPIKSWIARWPHSMPHYLKGHLERISSIETVINQLPGIELAGSSYNGVGIPDCIASGERAAECILESIGNHALL